MADVNVRLQEPPFALPFDTIIHGKYRIDKVLGFGGFGITYQGEDLINSGVVAIKEYYPSGIATRIPGSTAVEVNSGYEQYIKGKEKFLREARIIYHCHNEHILHIFSLFEENGTAYYVMEFLDGSDLRHYIKEHGGRLAWNQLKPFILHIMDALTAIHSEGVIHRDISPDNIYISRGGTAKLIDFGAARSFGGNRSLSIILKKGYAPPEQYQSRGKHGTWTDVYALGGTIFRALTGEMPVESIERIRNDTLRPPSSYGIKVPPEVDMAVMKAMNINEKDRFQTIEEFKSAIEKKAGNTVSTIFGGKLSGFLEGFTVFTDEIHSMAQHVKKNGGAAGHGGNPVLFCLGGMYASQSFTLDKDIIIGRDPEVCRIIFPPGTPGVSKVQCQICLNSFGLRAVVIDCDSSYGTFLNGIKLQPGSPAALNNGDIIQFGAGNIFRVGL